MILQSVRPSDRAYTHFTASKNTILSDEAEGLVDSESMAYVGNAVLLKRDIPSDRDAEPPVILQIGGGKRIASHLVKVPRQLLRKNVEGVVFTGF